MDEKERKLWEKLEEDRKKKELKKALYEQDNEEEIKKEKRKTPKFTIFMLVLLFLTSLTFSSFLIYDSRNRVNQIYEITNAILIFLITLSFIISFPKTFFKKKTGATIFTNLLIITTMVFNGLYLFNIIKLPTQSHIENYANKSFLSALDWTEKNKIDHEETFEYSDKIEKYNILNQSIKPNTLTKNIKNVEFSVSNGPDYNKTLILPDMTDKKTDDILKFVDENFLNNVDIVFEENEIENDKIIRQNTIGNIKRNDKLVFTASLGNKENLKPIKLKDLKNKKLLNTTTYLGKHGIPYELKFEYSNKVKRGRIIKTDKKPNDEIKQTDKIIITVSKGKEIKVPDLKNKTLKEVTKWMIQNNLQIEYSDKYDNDVKKGKVIETNFKQGDIIEEETIVKVVFSKGKLKLPKFDNIDKFKTWADKYQIKYEIKEEFSDDIPKDSIIKFSKKEGEKINPDETLTVYVSKGKAVKTPDFIGKTKEEINSVCNSLKINCSFYNTLSDKKEGTAISQSITKDTEIAEGTNIDIEIATKKQEEVTQKKQTTQTQNKNSNTNKNTTPSNNNQNNNQNNNPSPSQTCNIVVIRLNGSEVSPNNPNGTCNNLKNKYGNAINCSYVMSDNATNGFILNASEIRNKEASNCNPITVKIVKNN